MDECKIEGKKKDTCFLCMTEVFKSKHRDVLNKSEKRKWERSGTTSHGLTCSFSVCE